MYRLTGITVVKESAVTGQFSRLYSTVGKQKFKAFSGLKINSNTWWPAGPVSLSPSKSHRSKLSGPGFPL